MYLPITFLYKSLNISKVVTFLSRHMSAFSKRKIEYLIQLNPRKSVKLLLHFKVLHRVHDFEFLSSNVVTQYILKDCVSDRKYNFLI